MRTLNDAQRALREVDAETWEHEPGAITIMHTTLHLVHALAGVINGNRARSDLPGILIEQALRLSTAARIEICTIWRSPQCKPRRAWFHHATEIGESTTFLGLVLALMGTLEPFFAHIEQLDHSKASADRAMILTTVEALLRFAVSCAAATASAEYPTPENIGDMLEHFSIRLDHLWEKAQGQSLPKAS